MIPAPTIVVDRLKTAPEYDAPLNSNSLCPPRFCGRSGAIDLWLRRCFRSTKVISFPSLRISRKIKCGWKGEKSKENRFANFFFLNWCFYVFGLESSRFLGRDTKLRGNREDVNCGWFYLWRGLNYFTTRRIFLRLFIVYSALLGHGIRPIQTYYSHSHGITMLKKCSIFFFLSFFFFAPSPSSFNSEDLNPFQFFFLLKKKEKRKKRDNLQYKLTVLKLLLDFTEKSK